MEIVSSGIVAVPSGVSSTGLYLIQEGVLQVLDGGWAQDIGLAEGGQAFVSGGGILYICTVSSGGTATVLKGGYAQDVTVENGGLYLVSSGGTAHKSLLKSGGTQIVYADVMAAEAAVQDGGVLDASSGAYVRVPVVSQGGVLHVWNGALVDGAQISGMVEVNSKATVNSAAVLDGGKLAVLAGGYAYEAKISSGGSLDISSGGRANYTSVYEGGAVMVSAGASCNNAELNGGTVTLAGAVVPDDPEGAIIPGGFASKTTVNSGGFLFISSGGVANSTTVNSRGSMYVSSGGVANSTTVNSGGYLDVSSGGVASCAIVSEWGMMAVNKDGLADGTTVESDGRLYVSNGGTVSNATVESAGILYVSRGGTASGATVNSGGSMFVSSGGTATGLAADSGACLNFYVAPGTYIAGTYNGSDFVIEDGAVSDYTVNGNVKLFVSSGCTADVITVNSKGELRIRGGAAANGVTVNGGDLYVQNSGTATDIVWTPCEGHVYVYAGGYATFVNEYSGVYFGSGNKLLSSASPMDGKTLDADFEMYVMGGGAADNTTVNSGGMLYVQNGGAADHATVNSGGSMYISSGGTAAGATVNSSGELIVYSGGTATGAAVNSDGNLKVYFGGTADHAAVNEGGRLYVSADGTATGAAVNSDGELIVYSDGTAAGATVNDEGCLYVSAGGTATGVTVNSGGSMYISSGGTATGATVNSKGLIYVCNGGIATNILENGGYVYVGIDEDVTFLPNTIEDLVLEKASATLHSGTTASIATVNKDGTLQVCGGLADRVTLNDGGDMFVGSGGTAADITVYAGGRLELGFGGTIQSAAISSGGIVTGHVDCQGITFDPSAVLQFDLSVISPGNESALVNLAGLAEMPDSPSFTLLVSDSQNYGDYKLAENAWGFETKTISVSNSVMEFGALSLDRSVMVGNKEYTLNLNDGDLILSVNATQPTQYVYLDFDGENLVRYNNSDLELSFDLSVADPAFSDEQRAAVVSALSEQYGKYNIAFTLARPEGIDYSTLYFGVSSAFDEYGDFFGISETCDGNDQVRDDNAFVLVNSGYSDDQIITVASHMLDRLMGFSWSGSVDGSPAILKYAESKALLSLSAGWNQKDPYNKYCPIDPNTGDRCVVGCTNTAASQIIFYWIENGLLDFALTLMDSDAYQSNDYIMIESSDDPESGHLSFAETNKLLQSFNILDENCIAALCFAAGVVQQADYASDETATPWNEDLFIRAGFEKDEAAESIANDDGSSYYDILVHELLHGRPVGVSFLRQDHAIVADGYDSSRNMFHLDLGWGNDSNRWYTVEEMEDLSIYVDISGFTPAVSPDLTIEDMSAEKDPVEWKEDVTLTFTVSNDGKEMSEETMAYVYCGDAVLGACGITYISPGYSRDFTCTVSTASLKVGENVLTVKVDSQNDEGTISAASVTITCMNGDVIPQTQTWEEIAGATQYIVEYSPDDFEHAVQLDVDTNALDSYQLPEGNYQVRVKADDGEEWTVIEPVVAGEVTDDPKLVRSNADGNADAFFVNAVGIWGSGYAAQHVGSADDPWGGTKENVMLVGKNKLTDVFEGSDDANTLLMTDDANGDALFMDDIYSALPGPVSEQQARIARIDEIRAGAGDDIVDMTSNRIEYTGDGLTIRGGDGNDTIWANKGDNLLFGDAGNDRIVGASGNDVIAGGVGNDRMHGGGGDDIFTFCDNWGTDEVEQLADGSVLLWFASGSMKNWDVETLTYKDGDNSVTVSGVTADQITLEFGNDGSMLYSEVALAGGFLDFSSRRIFEESGKGILA